MLLTTEETQEALRQLVRDKRISSWNARDCMLSKQIIYQISLNPGNVPQCAEYTQAGAEKFLRKIAQWDSVLAQLSA